jgi:hypothetical protein
MFVIMKRVGIYFFTISLSLLVVLGSGQFTIGKMICLGSGHSSYVLGNATDCCDKGDAHHQKIEKPCCDLVTISYFLADFSISQKVNITAQEFNSFFFPSVFIFHQPFFKHLSFNGSPPPNSKDYLHFIGSLLI